MPYFFLPTEKLRPGTKGSVMCRRPDSVCNKTGLGLKASWAVRSRRHHAAHGNGQAKENIAALRLAL